MSITQEKSLEIFLTEIIRNMSAKVDDKQQLASFTKKVDTVDPLLFFAAAKTISNYRTYWTSTMDDFSLVGAGRIVEITQEGNRYKQLSERWSQTCAEAITHNPYQVPGTGIVALGGMSFDPLKKRTSLWQSFAESQLYIPEFLLTKDKENFYITINTHLSRQEDVSELVKQLREKEAFLMTSEFNLQTNLKVDSKHEVAPEEWRDTVEKAINKIQESDVEKIVMARELQLQLSDSADVPSILSRLLDTQSNSYIFAFDHAGDSFIGASPERLVKIEEDKLLSTCLAGTAPRGETETKDKELSYQFLHDEKNLGEHDFVVQMIRKSIEDFCHDIDIPTVPTIYKLKNLQHLYTPVQATLNKDVTIFDIIEQLHPTPALGGTPTVEALDFIRDYELLDRGWYGAPVGWLDYRNYGEFVVAIRSGLISGNEASLFAGCGIVSDSNSDEEYKETNMKFSPMINAINS